MSNANELATMETTEVLVKKEMTEAQANKLVQTITNKYNNIDKSFLGIMGDIAKAYDNGVHTYFGYTSFYEMASELWGIGRTSVKNMVMINKRFGDNYKIPSNWADFGTSKLLIIKDLSDEEIEELEISSDMTRAEITDVVNSYKGIGVNDDENNNDGEGADVTDGEDEDNGEGADVTDGEVVGKRTITYTLETITDILDFAMDYCEDNEIEDSRIIEAIKELKEVLGESIDTIEVVK